MKTCVVVKHLAWSLLVLGAGIGAASPLGAQTSTGRIQGTVSDSSGAALADAAIEARNPATALQRTVTTNGQGFYTFVSLPPGTYTVTARRIGHAPEGRSVRLQVGQTLALDFRLAAVAQALEEVTVRAAPAAETQTSEVATNVTQEQIQALPSSSRNFLDLASLAPGVRISPDRINGTSKTFSSGALPSDNINVFIDGQSFKNDLIPGGVIGQQDSRGNPFPRNAVQEFRIITNNYKAEYQKASSAIITAVTKSGGNRWEGSVFSSYQYQGLVALDTFTLRTKHVADSIAAVTGTPSTFTKPDYSRVLAGASLGGPIIRDKLYFFGAYEGNYQNRTGITRFNGDPAIWPAPIQALEGEQHTSPFRSTLAFGKLTYNLNPRQTFELIGNWRHETDERRFGGQFGDVFRAFSAGENFRNNVVDVALKHTLLGTHWLNEGGVSYQWYEYNPDAFNFDLVGEDFSGIGRIGGGDSRQDLIQKRLSFRNDFTYTGFQAGGSHVIKIGANLDFTRYNMNKQLNENPVFTFVAGNNFAFPTQAVYGFGNGDVKGTNNQVGAYLQDDWSPSSRLTINAGIRWDYESGMANRDFVTPQNVRDSVGLLNDSLFVHVDPSRYFTDGTQRKAFKGAFQPRVGFAYALDRYHKTTVFGSFGIFYDRFGFNSFLDETYRRQHPNFTFLFSANGDPGTLKWDPSLLSKHGLDSVIAAGKAPPQEVFLVPNDLKPPKSYQFSGGVRRLLGTVLVSATYTGIRGKNGFSFEWANLTLNPATNDCCISRAIGVYQNILVGNNSVRTWYDGLQFQIDRSYRRTGRFGWGAGIAYTLSWADREGVDLFSFPQVAFNARQGIPDDERHRVVMNWVTDLPFLFGIQFSGLITLGSGRPFNQISFTDVPGVGRVRTIIGQARPQKFNFIIPGAWAYRDVDLRLRKDFPNFLGTRLGVTADLFNVFNYQNLDPSAFDQTYTINGVPNPNFGKGTLLLSDPRRFQIGAQYDF
jgi:hypothetical protein